MNKAMKMATTGFLLIVLAIVTVWAVTNITFQQDLTVPEGSLEVYTDSSMTTQITEGSNQSGIWSWNEATKSFNATIYVYNAGSSTFGFGVSAGIVSGWTFASNAVGGTSNLATGQGRDVKLSMRNPSATSGSSTGLFTVTVAIV